MEKNHYGKLSLMMFLQYAVWGVWLPVLGQYLEKGLGFTGGQIGMILGLAGSIGAVTSPFIGQIADRKFSTERCLATLLLIGGVLKWLTAYQTSYSAWLVLSVLYSIVYMPTISLSNSLAFANIKNADKEFPFIRVWGTIGWIAASWAFPWFFLQKNLHFSALPPFLVGEDVADVTHKLVNALKVSGVISIIYAGFCLLLPHTPPKTEVKEMALGKALSLFGRPSFLLLVVASLPISIIHQIYFMKTGQFLVHIGFKESLIGPIMSIGQFFEIVVMAALGLMLTKLGFKWTIVIGALAYFLRYAIFGSAASLPIELVAASQALHGMCFSCFFAAGFIYVDRIAPVDIRHSAQTVFGIIILGVGPVAGGILLEVLTKSKSMLLDGGELNYSKFWYVMSGIGLATALLIAAAFRDETRGGGAAAISEDVATEGSEIA